MGIGAKIKNKYITALKIIQKTNPLAALRMSLKEVCGTNQSKVIDTIFEGKWCQKDLGYYLDLLEKQSIDVENLSEQTEPDVKESFETKN